jgi:hypothetical protein
LRIASATARATADGSVDHRSHVEAERGNLFAVDDDLLPRLIDFDIRLEECELLRRHRLRDDLLGEVEKLLRLLGAQDEELDRELAGSRQRIWQEGGVLDAGDFGEGSRDFGLDLTSTLFDLAQITAEDPEGVLRFLLERRLDDRANQLAVRILTERPDRTDAVLDMVGEAWRIPDPQRNLAVEGGRLVRKR